MRRLPTFAGAAVAVLGATAAVAVPLRGGDAGTHAEAAVARPAPLTVASRLPAWRVPGAGVTVAGFARAAERIVLRANGRLVASAVSGRLGGYRLRFAATRPGRYRLVVVDTGRSRTAGTLVVRPLLLDAVGDITFGEQVGPTIARDGAAYPWRYVAGTLRRADVTVGNLETAVSERGVAAEKEYVFRGAPSALPPLRTRAGFDVLTLANNHSGDYGPDALLDTLRSVRAAGIETIGAGATSARARRPAIVEAGGLRVAFLGYSDVNPLGFPATADRPGTARADPAEIDADVRAARRRADVVVCFFHWGTELHPDPDSRQESLAAACLNAGARLVLGAHPHVLGPLSRPDLHSLVAWSLGNFVFPSSGETARTGILAATLDRRGVRGYRLIPVRIDGFSPRSVRGRHLPPSGGSTSPGT